MKSSQIGILNNKDIHKDIRNSSKSYTPSSDKQLWFYKDPFGRVQGEFDNAQMLEWYRSGVYFTPQLQLRRKCDKTFSTLQFYTKLFDGIPFSSSVNVEPLETSFDSSQRLKNSSNFFPNDYRMYEEKRHQMNQRLSTMLTDPEGVDQTGSSSLLTNHLATCFLDPAAKNQTTKSFQSWPDSSQQYLMKNSFPSANTSQTLGVEAQFKSLPENFDLDMKNRFSQNELIDELTMIYDGHSVNGQRKTNFDKWYPNDHERLAKSVTNPPIRNNPDQAQTIGFYNPNNLTNRHTNLVNTKDCISCSNSSSGVHSQSSDSSPRPELVVTSFASSNIELNLDKSDTKGISSQKNSKKKQATQNQNNLPQESKSARPKSEIIEKFSRLHENCVNLNPVKSTNKPDGELIKLTKWTQDFLRGVEFKQSVDIPTIVELLATIDAPYEVENMFKIYLGETPKVLQFIKEFLDRRRPYWQKHNQAKLEQSSNANRKASSKTKKSTNNNGLVETYYTSDSIQSKKSKKAENQWQQMNSKKSKSKKSNNSCATTTNNQLGNFKASRTQWMT